MGSDLAKSSRLKLSLIISIIFIFIAIYFSFDDDDNNTSKYSSSSNNNNNNQTSLLFVDDEEQLLIPIGGSAFGPESFAFDPNGGGPYTGVSDGRIIKWLHNESRWVDFAVTSPDRDGCESEGDQIAREDKCGRPLGLSFNKKNGHLLVADAYMGLVEVTPKGGLATPIIAKQANRLAAFHFTNSLDIDPTSGVVYFTVSSTKYQRRNFISAIVSGDDTGKLMKYDPVTKHVSVVIDNLKFPNGVSLSKDGSYLILAETTPCRLLKFWLRPPKTGELQVIVPELPGFPDNVKRTENGEFLVAINSRRSGVVRWALSRPWVGRALLKLPFELTKVHSLLGAFRGFGFGVRIDGDGEVLEVLEGGKGRRWRSFVSEVVEEGGDLWVGSVEMPFVIKLKIRAKS